MDQSTVILITLVLYKLVLIGIGLWATRRTNSEDDFFIGGRGLGPWVAGLSYAASTSSAWVLLGFGGFVYAAGVSALWMIPGIWAGYVIVWLWFGPKLQKDAARFGLVTLTDFLTAQVSGSLRRLIAGIAAVLIVLCFIFYIAAQFDAAAKALLDQFQIGIVESVLIGATIVLIYSLLGGFWAVSVTDTLQGVIMGIAAVGLPLTAVIAAGGPGEMFAALAASGPDGFADWTGGRGLGIGFLAFALGIAAVGLGTLGQPHLLNRLMAVKDDTARRQGFAVAMSWGVLVYLGMAAMGLAGRVLIPEIGDGEQLFYRLAGDLLPTVLAGIVIAAILSAVMSTVDSILLAAAGAVAHDLGLARAVKGGELWISRIVMVVLAILAVILTLSLPDTIFNRVLFAWSALGAAFGPIVVARTAGVEPTARAILAAMLTGFGLCVLFYSYGTIPPVPEGQGLHTLLSQAGHAPGDLFERLVPWLPALAIVFTWRQPAAYRIA